MIELCGRCIFEDIFPLWRLCKYVVWDPTVGHLWPRIVDKTCVKTCDESTWERKTMKTYFNHKKSVNFINNRKLLLLVRAIGSWYNNKCNNNKLN